MEKEFIEGKWYKGWREKDKVAAKLFKISAGYFFWTEGIRIRKDAGFLESKDASNNWIHEPNNLIECSLEEIQQYLPDGHPDKIIKKKHTFTNKHGFTFEENEIYYYDDNIIVRFIKENCLENNSIWTKDKPCKYESKYCWEFSLKNVRKATSEEIAWLEACEKANKYVDNPKNIMEEDLSKVPYTEWKVGDTVERIVSLGRKIKLGQQLIIQRIEQKDIYFKDYSDEFDVTFFKLVKRASQEFRWVPKIGDWVIISKPNVDPFMEGNNSSKKTGDKFKVTKIESSTIFLNDKWINDENGNGILLSYLSKLTEDDFVLPEKWFTDVTKESRELLSDYRSTPNRGFGRFSKHIDIGYIDNTGFFYKNLSTVDNKKLCHITFEQFKKYVLKESIPNINKTSNNLNKTENGNTKESFIEESKRFNESISRRETTERNNVSFGGCGDGLETSNRERKIRSVQIGERTGSEGEGLCPGRRSKRALTI